MLLPFSVPTFYDRRGFGHSSQPSAGYDYDTFVADLKALLDHLAFDQEVVLAGFSMGSGEVTRYLGKYGSAGVSKAVLIGSPPPYVLQAGDNPKGVPRDIFEGLKEAAVADQYAFFDSFLGNVNNTDVTIPDRLSDLARELAGGVRQRPLRDARVHRHVVDGRSRRSPEDRHPGPGRARHRRPGAPVRGQHGKTERRAANRRSERGRNRRRPTQRRLDSPGRGQLGIALVPLKRGERQTPIDGDSRANALIAAASLNVIASRPKCYDVTGRSAARD
jgi:pimeloyl-ACP methyl ester carboxylesterase